MPRPKKVAVAAGPSTPKEALSRIKYLGARLAILDVLIDRLEGSVEDDTGERRYPSIVATTFGEEVVSAAVIDEVVMKLQEEATALKDERDNLWR